MPPPPPPHQRADFELRVGDAPPPDVRPQVTSFTVGARRVVRVAQYESYEVQLSMTAEPDPRGTTGQSIDRVRSLLTAKVEEEVARIVAEVATP
jgi:hypothetical protein